MEICRFCGESCAVGYGHCHCGCGQMAPIARRSNYPLQQVKGKPQRFIHNHHALRPKCELKRVTVDGDPCVLIPLTQGQFAIIDESKSAEIAQYQWYSQWSKQTESFYAVRKVRSEGKRRLLGLHRQILGLKPGDETQVDHQNGNTLDFRSRNLRFASHAENMWNRGLQKNNTSGYKGVSFDKEKGTWKAMIGFEGRKIHLGYFASAEKAADAYRAAAIKYHGRFARVA